MTKSVSGVARKGVSPCLNPEPFAPFWDLCKKKIIKQKSQERLHAENPQGAVVIQADQKSQNGLLVSVMDAARLAGVKSVSLAAEVTE